MKEKYIVVRKCVEGDKASEIKMVFFSVPLRLVQFFIYKLKSTTSIYASLCRIFKKDTLAYLGYISIKNNYLRFALINSS